MLHLLYPHFAFSKVSLFCYVYILCCCSFFLCFFLLLLFVSLIFPLPMTDFSKICNNDGTFKIDDINLDHTNTIKVFGKSGTLMELHFFVPDKEACINDFW